jgi:hypothetical protein
LTVARPRVYDLMVTVSLPPPRSALVTLALAAALASPAMLAGDDLNGRLRRVERAFRAADSMGLRSSFPSAGKVRVDLKQLSDGQNWYASGQLQFFFRRIFDAYTTSELRFREEDVAQPTPGMAFARGRWVRRPRRGGAEITETLVLTLREEEGDWRILEMLTSH